MDAKRRERLKGALNMLSNATLIIEAVCEKEEDCLDNYPENLQGTERYEKMEDAVDRLNDALENIETAKSSVESAMK